MGLPNDLFCVRVPRGTPVQCMWRGQQLLPYFSSKLASTTCAHVLMQKLVQLRGGFGAGVARFGSRRVKTYLTKLRGRRWAFASCIVKDAFKFLF